MVYKLGSLFDGSGGFPLAGSLCGITPVWAAEVEPYPIAVTRSRFPNMRHLGDISKVNGAQIEPVDVITFGSPCQDLSVAGKRAGLKHEANGDEETTRSGLFMEAVRIIKEMRSATNGEYPRFALWENVPGAFSSNKGEDFRIVCEELIKIVEPTAVMPAVPRKGWAYADSYIGDGWSLAYRVFDAQYWGVPQRRRRIHLVVDFRGQCAREVLFEREGVRGYSAESFRSWQKTTGSAADRAGTASLCLNDQGGQRMDVTDDVTATLRAEAHHPPCVLESAGFCTEHSSKSRSIGYEEETSPTLRAGVVPATVYENHSQDTRYTGPIDTAPTVSATYGMGGNNQPFVVSEETPKTLKILSGCEGGGKGALIQENKSATLSCNNDQTLFEPCNWDGQQTAPTLTAHNAGGNQRMPDKNHFNCVIEAYGICSKDSNSMKSDNPHSGVYKADTSRTLDGNGGNPGCNQGGIAIVEGVPFTQNQRNEVRFLGEKSGTVCQAQTKQQTFVLQGSMIGRADENGPQGDGINEDVSFTLNTVDRHSETLIQEQSPLRYIVRRLTPTECARLQGFADRWGDIEEKDNFTPEEYRFWLEVRNTHAAINGKKVQEYTEKQMLTWYNKLQTDSAEYKMWGNGIALPPALYCMQGIVDAMKGV